MADLSIIIPARNEMFLTKTVEDILQHMEGDTEIIVICDGNWPDPPIQDNPKVHVIYHSQSIGQRAATNEGAKYSRAKFIMKADAHCSFDQGFDRKLMENCEYDWTVVPRMYNLHAFDWRCKKCENRTYQGPTPTKCVKCGSTDIERFMVWQPRWNRQSDSMRFDSNLHFQYWSSFSKRPEGKPEICDTMSLLGACWFLYRERYWELDGMDEGHGSWGQMGTELACKTWLSGGRLVVNKKTWFSHMFRTQGGDFGFPYPMRGNDVEVARKRSRELWIKGKWPKAKYPLSWLIQKFAPVPDWDNVKPLPVTSIPNAPAPSEKVESPKVSTGKITKGLVYYTDNRIDPRIMRLVQDQLRKCSNGFPIVSTSLRAIDFGDNLVFNMERGHLTMAKQQLAGLEKIDTDVVFFVEHDVLYPACHFDFTPPRRDVFYYNLNWWKVRTSDGQALHFKAKQVSGLCAYKEILIDYYRKRVENIEKGVIGGRRHFEPGTKCRDEYKVLTPYGFETWWSEKPYVDIRHENCLSRSHFDPSGYKNTMADWTPSDSIPSWGKTKGRFKEWLKEVENAIQAP